MLGYSVLACAFFSACGEREHASKVLPRKGLTLDIVFPETLSQSAMEDLRQKIEIYRFYFSGSFPERPPVDIEPKKYAQYVFSDIPYDERLRIFIEVLSLNRHIVYCQGELTVNYHEGKEDRVLIPLRCP